MSLKDNGHLHSPVKDLKRMALYYVGEVAVIVMKNGENRINNTFLHDFNKLLDDVEGNSSCKGLITTGDGKFFCNGVDLEWLNQLSWEQHGDFFTKFGALVMRLLLFPLPTLAAINGHAYAGGALIAVTHDLRVMRQDKGWMCLNEVFIHRQFLGFHYPLMRTKIGSGQTYTDAVVLGKRYTGPEAFDRGLVHATAAATLLLHEAFQLLKSFYGKAGYPRESLHLMKADVYKDVIDQHEQDQKDPSGVLHKSFQASKL